MHILNYIHFQQVEKEKKDRLIWFAYRETVLNKLFNHTHYVSHGEITSQPASRICRVDNQKTSQKYNDVATSHTNVSKVCTQVHTMGFRFKNQLTRSYANPALFQYSDL